MPPWSGAWLGAAPPAVTMSPNLRRLFLFRNLWIETDASEGVDRAQQIPFPSSRSVFRNLWIKKEMRCNHGWGKEGDEGGEQGRRRTPPWSLYLAEYKVKDLTAALLDSFTIFAVLRRAEQAKRQTVKVVLYTILPTLMTPPCCEQRRWNFSVLLIHSHLVTIDVAPEELRINMLIGTLKGALPFLRNLYSSFLCSERVHRKIFHRKGNLHNSLRIPMFRAGPC